MKTYNYGQELPAEVESKLDAYIERVKAIKWFKPSASIDKSAVEKQVSVVLKAFGVEASLEYRMLKTPQDWDAARDAAWDAARDAARDAAWGADDLLAQHTPTYKNKSGTFLHLIPLYELGLWPLGVVDGKFIVAVPPRSLDFPEIK